MESKWDGITWHKIKGNDKGSQIRIKMELHKIKWKAIRKL